jgi:hypothetical protein
MSRWSFSSQAVRSLLAEGIATARNNPRRVLIVSGTGVLLVWLVLTRSFAHSLTETSPDTALWLNPNLSRALLTAAVRTREKLIATYVKSLDDSGYTAAVTERSLPPATQDDTEERKRLRAEIRALASRAIVHAPLNARAYRLLAEVTDEPDRVRLLMQEAFKRSRRESAAVFWLMNDSQNRNDTADVVAKADILLKTRPQLIPYVINFLSRVAETEDGRDLLVPLLADNPSWRATFFNELPKTVTDENVPLDLMVALKETGKPPTPSELAPYLRVLISKDRIDVAYNAWLQLIPHEKLTSLDLLNNEDFAEDPSGLPFDWSIKPGQNAMGRFVALQNGENERALQFSFGAGRAKFPDTSQFLLLAPGQYQLDGSFRGQLTAKRGLRWEIRCIGAKAPLAETDMLFGGPQSWQSFTLRIDIPESEECRAQTLRLYHHARSPSEELITGEISFRSVRLTRIKPSG